MNPSEKSNNLSPSRKCRTKNLKQKIRPQTPLSKCRTKRINSEKKKIIQGSFTATVNITDVCDETSTMEDGSSWITDSEIGNTTETIDTVFEDATKEMPENEDEDQHSSSEKFSRSEKQQDVWNVKNLHGYSIESPIRSGVLIMERETGKATENKDEVYEDTTKIIPEKEKGHSSPETFRRQGIQHDEWSDTHLHEEPIASPEKSGVLTMEPETGKTTENKDYIYEDTTKIVPENKDYVYEDTPKIVPEKEDHSSPETFRRSEKEHDDWSVTHLHEESIGMPGKGTVDDIVSSPERCTPSDSDQSQEGSLTSDKTVPPKIHPISPYFERIFDFKSSIFGPTDKMKEAIFKNNHETRKKSKLAQKGSEKHQKNLFHSTRIYNPEMNSPRFEDLDAVSSISRNQSNEVKCQHEKNSEVSEKGSEKHQKNLFHSTRIDDPKRNSPRFEDLDAVSSISRNKSNEDKCQHEKNSDVSEKGILSKEFSGKTSFLKVQRKIPFQRSKSKQDVQKKTSYDIRSDFVSDPKLLQPATSIPTNRRMEASGVQSKMKANRSVEALRQTSNKDVHETPKRKILIEHPNLKRQLWVDEKLRTKKVKDKVLRKSKREDTSKSSTTSEVVQEKQSLDIRPSTTIADQSSKKAEHSIEHMHFIESGDSIKAPSLHIFTANAETPLEETELPIGLMHIESGESIRAPSLHTSTANAEKPFEETELPIGLMHIESGESIRAPSLHISTANAEHPLEATYSVDGNQSKKTPVAELRNSEKGLPESKAKEYLLNKFLSSTQSLTPTEDVIPIETKNSSRASFLKLYKENAAQSLKGIVINDADLSKKTAAAKVVKQKKDIHKRKSKERSFKEKRFSTFSSSKPDNFLLHTEDEERIGAHSLRISEDNSVRGRVINDADISKKTAAAKSEKQKKYLLKIKSKEKSFEENRFLAVSSSKPIDDFVVRNEDEESIGAHSVRISEDSSVRGRVVDDADLSRKTTAAKLEKRKKNLPKRKSKEESVEEKRFLAMSSSKPFEDFVVRDEESIGANSLRISEDNSVKRRVIGNADLSKKTAATKLEKQQKNLPKRKSKEKSVGEKRVLTVSSSKPIKDFIVPDEESIGAHSLRISEHNSIRGTVVDEDESWKSLLPRTKKIIKSQQNKKSYTETEEEIISTPDSTILTQDAIDYMTTSETEKSNAPASGNSTEKFLEEMGLYESENSTKIQSSKLTKRGKNFKKVKSKDSKKKKNFAESLRDYKEYLKTIPIDDLSLKIRRDKLKHQE